MNTFTFLLNTDNDTLRKWRKMKQNLKDNNESRTANKGLNARQAEVLNSAFVLLFGICAKLNICASNPALRQAPNVSSHP